jgi:GNAT superfamily N-acetyltransferase
MNPTERTIRGYTSNDRLSCLAIFDCNTPAFFAPRERDENAAYLDRPAGPYLVVEASGIGVIGAGGYYVVSDAQLGGLAWGMVAPSWQHRGVGRQLLSARLERLGSANVRAVRVRTSQRSRAFYERAGFRESRVVPDGFAPGIHLVELFLSLHAAQLVAQRGRPAYVGCAHGRAAG